MLRATPNLLLMRPCDAVEAAECWAAALAHQTTPTVMALSRQKVQPGRNAPAEENLSARGGYVLREAEAKEKIVLIATGSEVELALQARGLLEADGIGARVVSLPCFELFAKRTATYRKKVLGGALPKVAVEAGVRQGWDAIIGTDGGFVGMSTFGESAPYKDLYGHFGITVEAVVEAAKARA